MSTPARPPTVSNINGGGNQPHHWSEVIPFSWYPASSLEFISTIPFRIVIQNGKVVNNIIINNQNVSAHQR